VAAPPRAARERARLQVDERRTQLLELGLRLFTDRSYDELSIDDIARAAGISKGLLYHYFPSKRDYYVEVVRRAAALLVERAASPGGDASPDALIGGLTAYLDFVEQHAASYTALMRGGVGSDPEVLEIVESARGAILERIVHRLGTGQPPPLVRTALRGWIGLVEAASLEWLARRDVPREELRALLARLLLASLFAAGAVPEPP
jgi:AcrR family transcriptional regulator